MDRLLEDVLWRETHGAMRELQATAILRGIPPEFVPATRLAAHKLL